VDLDIRAVFLTTNDPIYLPAFFDRVLESMAHKTKAVFIVPPLYRKQTVWGAFWRYFRTFGWEGVIGLVPRVIRAKIDGQSIKAVCKNQRVHSDIIQDVNSPDFLRQLQSMEANLIISVSCPQIFKNPLINMPSLGCLNIHGAILPNYRGILPSFWMLANNEKQGGISIYMVNEKIDAGDLVSQKTFEILPEDTLNSLLRRSKAIAADQLLEVINGIENGNTTRTPLDLSQGSYYSWPAVADLKRFRENGRRLW